MTLRSILSIICSISITEFLRALNIVRIDLDVNAGVVMARVFILSTHRSTSMNNAVWIIRALVEEGYAYGETSKRGQYLSETVSLG